MLDELSGQSDVRYVLFLDDRWSPTTLDQDWLTRALEILDTRPDVDLVSLQHRIDATDATDAATGEGFSKPFILAPSLLRADRFGTLLQRGTLLPPEGRKPPRRWIVMRSGGPGAGLRHSPR